MPRTYIRMEFFQYIELEESVTIDEFAAKFGISRNYAATWLSKWTGRGYLTHLPPKSRTKMAGDIGRPKGAGYSMGKKWWGEMVFGSGLDRI